MYDLGSIELAGRRQRRHEVRRLRQAEESTFPSVLGDHDADLFFNGNNHKLQQITLPFY
jgi:hypothetical protein